MHYRTTIDDREVSLFLKFGIKMKGLIIIKHLKYYGLDCRYIIISKIYGVDYHNLKIKMKYYYFIQFVHNQNTMNFKYRLDTGYV